jgi:hypothetical protein
MYKLQMPESADDAEFEKLKPIFQISKFADLPTSLQFRADG